MCVCSLACLRGLLQLHSKMDSVEGVSACIIMGSPMELGTGAFKLLRDVPEGMAVLPPPRSLLLDR